MQKKFKFNTVSLVMIALLVALDVVMNRFLSVNTEFFKLDTSFIPMAVGAYLFGPVGGMIIAGLGDLIGALIFPIGPYLPYFTITAALTGLWYGFVFKGKLNIFRVLLAVIPTQILFSLILNSIFLEMLYGGVIFWVRLVQVAISTPIQIIVIFPLLKKVIPLLKIGKNNK